MRQDGLDLGAKDQVPADLAPVQGLFADAVPVEQQAAALAVPQGQPEHAVGLGLAGPEVAVFLVGVDDGLGVAVVGAETVAALQQTLAQLQVIVNFAVKDHPEAVVFVGDGLAAGDQINDGQAPDGQGNLPVLIIARIVRPPMGESGAHPGQQGPVAPAGKTANSTHVSTNQKKG